MIPLVIVGAGGFGREVLDIIEAINSVDPTFDFLGFLDDAPVPSPLIGERRASVIGKVERLAQLDTHYLIGISSGESRKRIDILATAAGRTAAVAVHPAATMGAHVLLGPGSIVTAGVRLTTNIRLGRHVHVNINATVGHDCRLGDYVTINPGVNVSGTVSIGECAMLGTGSCVNQGLSIGAETIVGAGAAVVQDLPPGVVAVGIPARPR
jgi:sugar O-acyltransferase (sialic acid O-acetyltransferase NeuD family)